MALELLRLEILKRNDITFCCNVSQVSVDEASSVCLGLQMLVRLRGNKALSDKYFAILFSSSTLHLDTIFTLCQCFLQYIQNEKNFRKLPLVYSPETRKKFTILAPSKPPKQPVPSLPDVEYLARNPVATKTVCGEWEKDSWFFNQKGDHFVEFWKATHLTQHCLNLEKGQKVTAVLYYSLQHCESIVDDSAEIFYTSVKKETAFREFIHQCQDVFKVCCFLCSPLKEDSKPLEKFIDGFQVLVENIWEITEDFSYGSNHKVSTAALQTQLSEAAFYRQGFLQSCQKLYDIAHCLLEWKGENRVKVLKQHIDAYQLIDLLCYELHTVCNYFATLDKAAGSLSFNLQVPNEYQGFEKYLDQRIGILQDPFRGISVQKVKNIHYDVEWISIPSDLVSMQTWDEVENYFRTTRKPSKGAGIAFLLNKRILLPLSHSTRSVQDKWIGGKVEPNESWIDAAWREFDEETFVRADPWVDEVKVYAGPRSRKMYFDNEKELPFLNLDEIQQLNHHQVWMIATENNIQIERHVKCRETYPRKRTSTREIIRYAFDHSTSEKKYEFLVKLRLIAEKSENNRKTYQTFLIDLEPLLNQPRVSSIIKIPIVFPLYASEIQRYAEPCFADFFTTEPLKLNVQAMKNNEHPGFEWVRYQSDDRLDRIKKAFLNQK